MNHFLLKFNHGVEIGARLAYLGHYRATGDENIKLIADDELEHRLMLLSMLKYYDEKPSKLINAFFTMVGTIIYFLCFISPKSLLDKVAQIMEFFAVFNYEKLIKLYPRWSRDFEEMAMTEGLHQLYFSSKRLGRSA